MHSRQIGQVDLVAGLRARTHGTPFAILFGGSGRSLVSTPPPGAWPVNNSMRGGARYMRTSRTYVRLMIVINTA